MSESEGFDELVRALTNAHHILIFTGAGISTGSGIPDYRGPQGLWKTRKPIDFHDFMADESKRREYWQQKSEDWVSFAEAEPTPAHKAICSLAEAGKLEACATQNIDGLHAMAGLSTNHLIELHGSNRLVECMSCGRFEPAEPFYLSYKPDTPCPLCACGGFWKPAVISFGQSLREKGLEKAQKATLACDLVIALGSTLSVTPAATFPIFAARNGVPYHIINQGPTHHDGMPMVAGRIEADVQAVFPEAVQQALLMCG